MARMKPLAGVGVAAILVAAPAFAEEAIPVGPEFRVSRGHADYYAYNYDGQAYDADVARTPNGQFVVVWQERVETYSGYTEHQSQRIEARRFNRDGTGAGQQFTILQGEDPVTRAAATRRCARRCPAARRCARIRQRSRATRPR